MRSINHLTGTELKLELVKTYLRQSHLEQDIQTAIENATYLAEIWCLLFQHELFDVYDELLSSHIVPSEEEMNQVTSDNTTAWFWLSGMRGKENASRCLNLFNAGVLPNDNALNLLSSIDNTAPWFWFLSDNDYIPVVEFLFKHHKYPHDNVINAIRTIDSTSILFWTSSSAKRLPFFKRFLHKDIPIDFKRLETPYASTGLNAKQYLASQDAGKNILDRIYQIKEFSKKYGIESNTKMSMILSREHRKPLRELPKRYGIDLHTKKAMILSRDYRLHYCAYLYSYYLKINQDELTPEGLKGDRRLPKSLKKLDTDQLRNELMKDENLITFLKYYMINSLQKYCDDLSAEIKSKSNDIYIKYLSTTRDDLNRLNENIKTATAFMHTIRDHQDPRLNISHFCETSFFKSKEQSSAIDDKALAKKLQEGNLLSKIKKGPR